MRFVVASVVIAVALLACSAFSAEVNTNEWIHAQFIVDTATPLVSATVTGVSIPPLAGEKVNVIGECRFTIGNDFIAGGAASSRWYDNVTALVSPLD